MSELFTTKAIQRGTQNSTKEEHFNKSICELIKRWFQKKTDQFGANNNDLKRSILLFPPLTPRGRFLIHKCTESFCSLKSISIGSSEDRRVVIFNNYKQRQIKNQGNSNHLNRVSGNLSENRSKLSNITMSSPSPNNSPRFIFIYILRNFLSMSGTIFNTELLFTQFYYSLT